MSEWISVEDRLPPEDQVVVLYNQTEGFDIGWQHNGFWFGPTWLDNPEPTHWHELPEPPK